MRLLLEPTSDRIDDFDRLLRYVVRLDGVNVNLRLVAVGAAAPYFYEGQRGMYANRLEALAKRARARHLGLWGACPNTRYDPYHGIETHRWENAAGLVLAPHRRRFRREVGCPCDVQLVIGSSLVSGVAA